MAEHWCKEHQTTWFKKGKMKNYAHPILDEDGEPTGKWCNEPEAKADAKAKAFEPSSGSTNASIEAQVAIKEIGLNLRTGFYEPDNLKLYPEINSHAHLQAYDRWLQSRTLPFGEGAILDPVPNAGEERRQQVAKDTTPVTESSEQTEYPRIPESLQNIGGLVNALREDTKDTKLTIATVEKVLNRNKEDKDKKYLGEIVDIPQAYRDFIDWHRGEKKEVKE